MQTVKGSLMDPDLFVRWNNTPTREDYTAQEISSATQDEIYIRLSNHYAQRLYIGVLSFFSSVNTTVEIFVETFSCLNRDCGNHGTCNKVTGDCDCQTGFTARHHCQAKVVQLTKEVMTKNNIYPDHLHYEQEIIYNMTVQYPLPNDIAIFFDRARLAGEFKLRLRHGELPLTFSNEHVIASVSRYSYGTVVRIPQSQLTGGQYYLSVTGTDILNQDTFVSFHYNQCPHSCNDHGFCNSNNNTCTCDKFWNVQEDCSVNHTALTNGQHFNVALAGHSSQLFEIGANSAIAMNPCDIVVRTYSPQTLHSYPRLYIRKGARPEALAFDYTNAVPAVWNATVKIPHTDVNAAGLYFLQIQNAEPTAVSIQVVYEIVPFCPPKCHHHGECTSVGLCICRDGWAGGDCSVELTSSHGISVAVLVVSIFIFLFIGLCVGGCIVNRANAAKKPQGVDADGSSLQYAHMGN